MNDKRITIVAEGFFTVEEACDYLRTTRTTLYAAMQRGEVPYVKSCGKRLVPKRALMQQLAAQVVGL